MIDFETFDADPNPQQPLPFPTNTQASLATTLWAVGVERFGLIEWMAPVYGDWTPDHTLAGLYDLERAEFIAHLAHYKWEWDHEVRVVMVPETCIATLSPAMAYVYGRPRTAGEHVERVPPALSLGFEAFA